MEVKKVEVEARYILNLSEQEFGTILQSIGTVRPQDYCDDCMEINIKTLTWEETHEFYTNLLKCQ